MACADCQPQILPSHHTPPAFGAGVGTPWDSGSQCPGLSACCKQGGECFGGSPPGLLSILPLEPILLLRCLLHGCGGERVPRRGRGVQFTHHLEPPAVLLWGPDLGFQCPGSPGLSHSTEVKSTPPAPGLVPGARFFPSPQDAGGGPASPEGQGG